MHTMIKAAWTAAIVIVVAWPLLFWASRHCQNRSALTASNYSC